MKQKVKRNSVNSTIYDRPSKADTGLELPQSFAAKMTTAEELQTQVNALQAEVFFCGVGLDGSSRVIFQSAWTLYS
jgi:hypothetical protein